MTGEELWAKVGPYAKRVSHYFFSWTPEAEDLCQEAAILCLRFPERYPGKPDNELSWLVKRSIWNYGLDMTRHLRVTERKVAEFYRVYLDSSDPAEVAESNEIFARIHEELSDADRGVYFMQAWGYSRAEIADRRGCSERSLWRSRERIADIATKHGLTKPSGYSDFS